MKSVKNIISLVILICLVIVFVLFGIQNDDPYRINLFGYSTPQWDFWVFILFAFLFGVIIMMFYCLLTSWKYKSKIRKQQKEIFALQKEIHDLRNQPIDDIPQDSNVEVATLVEDKDI